MVGGFFLSFCLSPVDKVLGAEHTAAGVPVLYQHISLEVVGVGLLGLASCVLLNNFTI